MAWRLLRQSGWFALIFAVGCTSAGQGWGLVRPTQVRETPRPRSSRIETPQREQEPDREPLIARSSEPKRPPHDPQTRMLIETELRDATPTEREEWLAYLNNVETEMVPYILRSRRVGKHPPSGTSPPNSEPDAPDEILPAAHAAPSTPQGPVPASSSSAENAEPQEPAASHSPQGMLLPPFSGPESEAISVGLNAPEPAEVTGWPRRIRSLTDWETPSLWPSRQDDDSGSAPRDKGKSERGPFGLPQIRGQRGEPSEPRGPDGAGPAREIRSQLAALDSPLAEVDTRVSTTQSPRLGPVASHWEEELHRLISLMEAETSSLASGTDTAGREDIRKQVALRMLYLISNEPQLAQQAVTGVSRAEQEFWTALFWGLSEYLDEKNAATPTERAARTIAQLRSATHQLQQTTGLNVRNVTFCERINNFGNYERFESDQFSPGQPVLLYCEIRNFKSEPTVDGFYRTAVKSTLELYHGGPDGKLIDRNVYPATEDRCRTLRTDYYHSYRIDLPMQLSPGPHVLKLTLQDELSGKIATETIGFTVK